MDDVSVKTVENPMLPQKPKKGGLIKSAGRRKTIELKFELYRKLILCESLAEFSIS